MLPAGSSNFHRPCFPTRALGGGVFTGKSKVLGAHWTDLAAGSGRRSGSEGKVQPAVPEPEPLLVGRLGGKGSRAGLGRAEGCQGPLGFLSLDQPGLPRGQTIVSFPGWGVPHPRLPPLPVAGWGPDEEQYCESCTEKVRSLSPSGELLRGRGELEALKTLGNTKGGGAGRDAGSGDPQMDPWNRTCFLALFPRPPPGPVCKARAAFVAGGRPPSLPDAPPTPRLLRGPGRIGRRGGAG